MNQLNLREPGCLWGIAGGLLGLVLLLGILILTRLLGVRNTDRPTPTVALVVIANPSPSPAPTLTPTPREWPTPTVSPTPPAHTAQEFVIGALVEVIGTEGDGLRMRAQPGLQAEIKFLGLDHEVFRVVDGPREVDGYRWWNLENPFDSSKSGWAVDLFLQLAASP